MTLGENSEFLSRGTSSSIAVSYTHLVMAVVSAIYNIRNATAKNRHSVIDITDSEDEPDPLDPRFRVQGGWSDQTDNDRDESLCYCPYCGQAVEEQFDFCPGCGKELPGK